MVDPSYAPGLEKGENKTRLMWADLLRIFSIFLVVMLHTTDDTKSIGTIGRGSWINAANFFQTLVRISVPLFVMLSGAVNLRKENKSALYFFWKNILRIALLFVTWGIIYTIFRHLFYGQELSLIHVLREIVDNRSNAHSHLWFLYMLLGLYLLTPILRVYVKNASDKNIFYLLLLWFLLASAFPCFFKLAHITFNLTAPMPLFVKYIGYYVLGYFLYRLDFPRESVLLFCCLYVAGFFATAIGEFYLNANSGAVDTYLLGDMSPTIVLMSTAVFGFFKTGILDNYAKRFTLSKRIVFVSESVLGVYLLHILVLALLDDGRFGFSAWAYHRGITIGIPLTTITCFTLSLITIAILRKIPVIRAAVS